MTVPPIVDLTGKSVLITGAGSGVGLATATMMAAHGAKVAITEMPGRASLARTAVRDIRDRGGEALDLTLDVTSVLTIQDAVDHVAGEFGAIDILVNNAGVQLLKPALDIEEAEFDNVLDVNLKGAFFCSQAVASIMAAQGQGVIVNVASQHGVVGNKNRAPYCASKAGLINLTRALAIEWAALGIRVNSISPTFVVNEANADLLASEDFRNDIEHHLPSGRPAQASEVAAGICYLASPIATSITGHNLMIDGGWTAR